MHTIEKLSVDPRVTVRRPGVPNRDGNCIVYWMQRAQRAFDNPALDVAVGVANDLRKPVVVFFAPVPFFPRANYRHFHFLAHAVSDIANGLSRPRIGFVFRSYSRHNLMQFCGQVRPSMVIADENPLRETEEWRRRVARGLRVPFWTVDADVIVPSKLLEREHYAARTMRPHLIRLLPQFLTRPENPVAWVQWAAPRELHSEGWAHDFTRN